MVTGAEIGEGEVLEIGGERMKYGQSDLTAVISVKYSPPPPQCLRYKVTKLKKKIKINRESKIALI